MSESQKMSRTGNQYSKRGSNPRSSVDYAQNDSGQKTERFPSEGMIMLTLSDKGASNLVAWREILRARACDAFGDNDAYSLPENTMNQKSLIYLMFLRCGVWKRPPQKALTQNL